jgi:hypothetical protein
MQWASTHLGVGKWLRCVERATRGVGGARGPRRREGGVSLPFFVDAAVDGSARRCRVMTCDHASVRASLFGGRAHSA